MPVHAFGKVVGDVQRFINPVREEMKERSFSNLYFVYVIGPVNQQATPDHTGQNGKIEPVKPPDGQGMLNNNLF